MDEAEDVHGGPLCASHCQDLSRNVDVSMCLCVHII